MGELETRSGEPNAAGSGQDMRIVVVLGTRPEAIKLSPVILELKRRDIDTIVINTGQHRDMVHNVLDWFGIEANVDLKLMMSDQLLCSLTWKLIERLPEWYRKYKPDVVMVQGDTTTAMAGALAAYYEGFPVAHVEAGLRTFNNLDPFPEEANRRMITAMATWHFAPTKMAADNLFREGIPFHDIFITGNPGIDALHITLDNELPDISSFSGRRIIPVTVHRRENSGKPLENISEALIQMVERNHDIEIIYLTHPNPKIQEIVFRKLSYRQGICLLPPVSYPNMVNLLNRSDFVLTDSGGIQEEAAYLGKPCLVLRNETERREGIEAGIAKLIGTDTDRIVEETEKLLNDEELYRSMATTQSRYIYGDGHAAETIVDILIQEKAECSQLSQRQSLSGTARSTWSDVLIV